MAVYYFDNTSPASTAGFGTLTGNWADSKWSDGSGGASSTVVTWPGAGNVATFGGATGTAVGGTLTATGTVALDGITVQNLSTTTVQTLSGGTLNFGSVNGAISVGAAGSGTLTINSLLAGTNGFTKVGARALTLAGNNTGLSGTVTVSAGGMTIGNGTTSGSLANADVVVNSGQTLTISRSTTTLASLVKTLASASAGAGTLSTTVGTLTITDTEAAGFSGTLSLDGGSATINTAADISMGLAGTVAGTVTKQGDGKWAIPTTTGTTGQTGNWTISAGTLDLSGASGSVGTTGATAAGTVTIAAGARLTTSNLAYLAKSVTVNSGGFLGSSSSSRARLTGSTAALVLNGTAQAYIVHPGSGAAFVTLAMNSVDCVLDASALQLNSSAATAVTLNGTVTLTGVQGAGSSTPVGSIKFGTLPGKTTISYASGNTTTSTVQCNALSVNETTAAGGGAVAITQSSGTLAMSNMTSEIYVGQGSNAASWTYWKNSSASTVGGLGGGQYNQCDLRFGSGHATVYDCTAPTASPYIKYLRLGAGATTGNTSVNFLAGGFAGTQYSAIYVGAATTPANRQLTLTLQNAIVRAGDSANGVSLVFNGAAGAEGVVNVGTGADLYLAGVSSGSADARINLIGTGKLRGTSGTSAVTWSGAKIYLYGTSGQISADSAYTTSVLGTISEPTPGSYGLADMTFSPGLGAGYIGAPVVTITNNATGTGARGYATVTDGKVTGVTITCPGYGYENGTTTISFDGPTVANGGCTTVAGTITGIFTSPGSITYAPSPHESGGFTAANDAAGVLALVGDNTFTGPITVASGTLATGTGTAAVGKLGKDNASPITLGAGKTLRFNSTTNATYANVITGAGSITSVAASTSTLSGASPDFTGATTVTAGTIKLTNSNALGATGAITVSAGASRNLELSGGITVPSGKTLTLSTGQATNGLLSSSGDNTFAGAVTLGANSALVSSSGASLTVSGTVALGAYTATIASAGTTTISGVISAGSSTAIAHTGAGTTQFTNIANTFAGSVSDNGGGTIEVKRLRNVGAGNSSLGAPTTVQAGTITFSNASANLTYSGGYTSTTDRTLSFTGGAGTATLSSTGTAPISYTGTWSTATTGNRTLRLNGTNADLNRYDTLITNPATSGTTSLVKEGTGTWVVSKANTFTGDVTVSGGTLFVTGDYATKRLGANNTVTVSTGGTLRTSSDSSQKGRATYRNLTLSGGNMRLGGSTVSPTVILAGNLTLPISGTTTWNFTSDIFKNAGSYRVIEFDTGFGLVSGQSALASVTAVVPAGRSVSSLTYTAATTSEPAYITLVLA